jgi:hypothetical protein
MQLEETLHRYESERQENEKRESWSGLPDAVDIWTPKLPDAFQHTMKQWVVQ